MGKVLDKVVITDSVNTLITKFNNSVDAIAVALTVSSNSTPDVASGNSYVDGIFGANVITANILRGGNVTSSNTLTISSNVIFSGASVNTSANVNITGMLTAANLVTGNINSTTINATSISLNGTSANSTGIYTGFSTLTSTTLTVNVINISTALNINSTFLSFLNTTANSTVITSPGLVITGSANVQNDMSVFGNLYVNGSLTYVGSSVANGDLIPLYNNQFLLGNSTNRWITYVSNVNVSDTLTSNNIDLTNAYIATSTTTTTGTSAQLIDSFSASTFRSAKYLITAKDNAANNYNSTELLLLHDGSDAYTTEYATVFSNSIIGTYSANISGTTVRLYLTPSSTSTTIKLFKTMVDI